MLSQKKNVERKQERKVTLHSRRLYTLNSLHRLIIIYIFNAIQMINLYIFYAIQFQLEILGRGFLINNTKLEYMTDYN